MMFIIGNFVYAIAVILRIIINFWMICIIVSAILSFLFYGYYNPVRQFFDAISEVLVGKIRRYMPFLMIGPIDFSPFVAILLLIFIDKFLVQTLFDLARILH